MDARMKRQKKFERQLQPQPTIRSGMSLYLAMESRSNMDKHKYTTKRKHNDHHVSKEEKGAKTHLMMLNKAMSIPQHKRSAYKQHKKQ
jgi:hypothetical protein